MKNTPEVTTSYPAHYRIPGYLLVVYAALVFGLGWFCHQRWADIHAVSPAPLPVAAQTSMATGTTAAHTVTLTNGWLQPGAMALATTAPSSSTDTQEPASEPVTTAAPVGWQTAKVGELPYIAFSAHVYTSEVDKRSVTLNGERYHEGDTPYPGLIIEQIEQDMVILSFNGEPFILDSLQDWPGGKPDTESAAASDEPREDKPALKTPKTTNTAKRD
ncbi:type II secretion system assembly factor GspB [Dickeya lacustris]|uniref:Type II secretion system assembly factor GspB n=1 Tax=Dickeya lacustris TaxID=2259638 RepID=A0ABY8G9T3_9GAMM|nr:type II secretion system assembly factor GspB [Dickeya lacustris]WFN56677.1 type II secretion system assembly factor GspB [Dickeya lacustris]